MTTNTEFDKFAQKYRDIHTNAMKSFTEYDSYYFAQHKIEIVKNNINYVPKKILDFGCGDGLCSQLLAEAFPESEIVGIDISEKQIEQANLRKLPNCTFIHENILEESSEVLNQGEFDLVFSAGVFAYIRKEDYHQLLNKFLNILKEQSNIFVFENNPLNPVVRMLSSKCILDQNAEWVWPNDFVKNVKKIKHSKFSYKLNYFLFVPRYKIFQSLFFLDKYLKILPLGASYYLQIQS